MKKYGSFYSETISIKKDTRDIEDFNLYMEDVLSLEKKIDRTLYICKKLSCTKHPRFYALVRNKDFESKIKLTALYRRIAGYAVWLKNEYIKQQCEIIKKLNEV